MFGEQNQVPPSLPNAGFPSPFAGTHTDPHALLAYANMMAAYAQQQMQQSVARQHPVAMPAPQFGAGQLPSPIAPPPSPKLAPAKRAPASSAGSSLWTIFVCLLIGAIIGFSSARELPAEQGDQSTQRQQIRQ